MEERNNLDVCLDSIFENHLRFQIKDSEVNFIQTAIETLVSKLIDKIDTYGKEEKTKTISEFLKQNTEFKRICKGDENNEKILKTGSFYEGTKNGYPDEFDYVYVICTLEVEETFEDFTWRKHYFTLNEFHETIKDIVTKKMETKEFQCLKDNKWVIYLDRYNRKQGPSSKLTFKYKIKDIQTNEERDIDVDIVPAFKVIDKRLHERIWDVCFVAGFAKNIAATKSYLITNEVSFTETEGLFMMSELSPGHKKAYRLLKYILNGNGDGEKLRKYIPKVGISTYMIKVATINHHFTKRCDHNWFNKPSDCVIMILKDILWFCIDYGGDNAPYLKKFHGGLFEMQVEYVIQTEYSIKEVLRWLLLLRKNTSIYEDIKSVSKCIFDYTQRQSSTGHLSCNSSKSYSKNECSLYGSSKRLSISLTDFDNQSLLSRRRNDSRQNLRFEMYGSDVSQTELNALHRIKCDATPLDNVFSASSSSFSSKRQSSDQGKSLYNAKDNTRCTKLKRGSPVFYLKPEKKRTPVINTQLLLEDNKAMIADSSSENQGKANLLDKRPHCLRENNEDFKSSSNGNREETYGNAEDANLCLQNQRFESEIVYSHLKPFLEESSRSENDERVSKNPTTLKNQSARQSEVAVKTLSPDDFEFIIVCGNSKFYPTRTSSTPCFKSDNIGNQRIRSKSKKKGKRGRCILM